MFVRCFKKIVVFLTVLSFSFNCYAASSQIVTAFYEYAKSGQYAKVRTLIKHGYDVDVKDDDGRTAYCLAKEEKNEYAMMVLARLGADREQKCASDPVAAGGWGKKAAIVGGIALIGGGVALAAGGGGGGGSGPCDHKPNSHLVDGVCQCEEGYLDQDGTCYADLSCTSQIGSTGAQAGDQCVCRPGYEGTMCDMCSSGYLAQDGACYQDLKCAEQSGSTGVQNGDQCVCQTGYVGALCNTCDSGYLDFDGVCYAELSCVHGTQQADQCVCDAGYKGDSCDSCADGYVEYGGACYLDLGCVNGTQQGDHCVCNTGYTGSTCTECDRGYSKFGDACYINLACQNGTQNGNKCDCNDANATGILCDSCVAGYINNDGVCYAERTDCDANASQVGDTCVCNEGFIGDGTTCYAKLECVNGTQENDRCICNEHASGTLCESCEAGFGHDSTDACVAKAADVHAVKPEANYNMNSLTAKTNKDYADFYGISYDVNDPITNIYGDKKNLYNNYTLVDESVSKLNNFREFYLTQNGDGDVYGLYSDNAENIYNLYALIKKDIEGNLKALVDITNNGDGTVYGMRGNGNLYNLKIEQDPGVGSTSITIDSEIKITNNGKGASFGMFSGGGSGKSVSNEGASKITVKNTNAQGGDVYGIFAEGGNVVNSGSITVSNVNGEAYGIRSNGGDVANSGTISVTTTDGYAYGIYADGGAVTNGGTIRVKGNADNIYGIYATNGATVTNNGYIYLNSVRCHGSACEDDGHAIFIDETSVLSNAAEIVSTASLDLDQIGGTTLLASGGSFKVDGTMSGELGVDASVVDKGFEDVYVEKEALQADNLAVSLRSKSAMFKASSVENDNGTADVVMTRQAFAALSSDHSISDFLEQNYQLKQNETLFKSLKSADTSGAYRAAEAELLGYRLIPNFSQENMNIFRNLNNVFNEELFTAQGVERKMVGYDFLYQGRDSKNTLTGYENYANTLYFIYDREFDNLVRSGFGVSITRFRSDYDDDSSRKEIMVQALLPVSYRFENGLKWASIARAGYGNGDYKRRTKNQSYESDISEWIYGLSNAVRYEKDLGVVLFEPVAELNVLGYYQNRIREDKNMVNAIRADAENNLSVEAGLGFNLRKAFELGEKSRLTLNAGAMYYHEFSNPYHSLNASIYGMDGTYRLTDYEGIYDRDRGLLKAGFEYEIKPFTVYGNFRQYLEDENPFNVNLGLKYNF